MTSAQGKEVTADIVKCVCFYFALQDESASSENWTAVAGQTMRQVWELPIEATRNWRNSWDRKGGVPGTREVFRVYHGVNVQRFH